MKVDVCRCTMPINYDIMSLIIDFLKRRGMMKTFLNWRMSVVLLAVFVATRMSFADVSLPRLRQEFSAHGGTDSIVVESGADSDGNYYSALANVPWIKLAKSSGRFGTESLGYSVEENTTQASRVGTITLYPGSKYFTVIQKTDDIEVSTHTQDSRIVFSSSGGSSSVSLAMNGQYPWAIESKQDWLYVSSTNGYGPSDVELAVPNWDECGMTYRMATLNINGKTVEIIQSGNLFEVSSSMIQCGGRGGAIELSVTPIMGKIATKEISWSASSDRDYVTIESASVQQGPGTLRLSIAANTTGDERTAQITIDRVKGLWSGDEIFFASDKYQYYAPTMVTLIQKPYSTAEITVFPQTVEAARTGEEGTARVETSPALDWQAVPSADWLALEGVKSGHGNGTFNWSASINSAISPRTGCFYVRDLTSAAAGDGIDLAKGLVLWIDDMVNKAGTFDCALEKPLSAAFDGSSANSIAKDLPIANIWTNGCSFACSINAMDRTGNALFSLGKHLFFRCDDSSHLEISVSQDGKTIDGSIGTSFRLLWPGVSYTILVVQSADGTVIVHAGQKGTALEKVAEFEAPPLLGTKGRNVLTSEIILGKTLLPNAGFMNQGRFSDVRLWARPLDEQERRQVDNLRNSANNLSFDAGDLTCSWSRFALDGNVIGSAGSEYITGNGSIGLSVDSEVFGAMDRFGREGCAMRAENIYTIPRFSEIFKGSCITNNNAEWPYGGICVPPKRESYSSPYGGSGSGFGYFCKHGYNSDDYFPYPMVATGECEEDATYSFWICVEKYPSGGTKEVTIFARNRPTTDDRGVEVDTNGANARIALILDDKGMLRLEGSGFDAGEESVKVPLGVWTQIAIVGHAKDTVGLYVNGEQIFEVASEMTLGYLPPVDRRCFCQGSDVENHGAIEFATLGIGRFCGVVDDMVFYHAALTRAQVRQAYELNRSNMAVLSISQPAAPINVLPETIKSSTGGGTYTINVNTESDVVWGSSFSSDWISLNNDGSFTGAGSIDLTIAPNKTILPRSEEIIVAGAEILVSQDANDATVDFPIQDFSYEANSCQVDVYVEDGVIWNASSDASWLKVYYGTNKTGSGQFLVTMDANAGCERQAHVTVGTNVFVVTQSRGNIVASPASCSFGPWGGSSRITLDVLDGSQWTARSDVEWITLDTTQGTGSGDIGFGVDINFNGAERTGKITIGTTVVTITQGYLLDLPDPCVIGTGGKITSTLDKGFRSKSTIKAVADVGYNFDHWEYTYTSSSRQITTTKYTTSIEVEANEYVSLHAYFTREKLQNLTATNYNFSPSVLLTWKSTPYWVHTIRIYRSENSTMPNEPFIETSSLARAEYEDKTCEQGKTYYYWIEAVDLNFESSITGPVKFSRVRSGVLGLLGPKIIYAGEKRLFLGGELSSDGSLYFVDSSARIYSMSPAAMDGVEFNSSDYPYGIYPGKCSSLTVDENVTSNELTVSFRDSSRNELDAASVNVKIIPATRVNGPGTFEFDMWQESRGNATSVVFKAMVDGKEQTRTMQEERATFVIDCIEPTDHVITWKTEWNVLSEAANKTYGVVSNLVWHPAPANVNISFDPNGGSSPVVSKVYATGTMFGDLPTPSRGGYDFVGWSVDGTENTIVDAQSYVRVVDSVLTALWTPCRYRVEFALGVHASCVGGGGLVQSVEYLCAAEAPQLEIAPGYEFAGWSEPFDSVTSNMTVNAEVRPVVYTIEYMDVKGAANGNPLSYTVEDAVEFSPLPDVPGWHFMGWSSAVIPVGSTGKKAVTARWEQIKYHVSGAADSAEDYVYGQALTFSTDANVTNGWTNIVCIGWVGTGDVPSSGQGSTVSISVTQDSSIQWLYRTNYWFAASAGEGGSVSLAGQDEEIDLNGCWVPCGDMVELVVTPDTPCHFVRWSDAVPGNAGIDVESRAFTVDRPMILSALFTDILVVQFDLGGKGVRAGGGDLHQEVRSGGAAQLPEVSPNAGYRFVGWSGDCSSVTSDITVAAEYERIPYGVIYEDTHGCANGNVFSYTVEDSIRFSALTNPPGWRFLGWAPSSIERGSTGDKTIVALWEHIEYTVRFDLGEHGDRVGGGDLVQTLHYGEAAAAPQVGAKAGYDFAGWDGSFDSVPGDLVVTARYKPTVFAIEYVDVKGCENPNVSTYTINDSVEFSALANPPGWEFLGWEPSRIAVGTVGKMQIAAKWRQLRYNLSIDGEDNGSFVYGQELTLSTDENVTNGNVNIVCIGWVGIGDIPATGTTYEVSFTMTQPSSISWLYVTNYWTSVCADPTAGGSVEVLDAEGNAIPHEGWIRRGEPISCNASAGEGYAFWHWVDTASNEILGEEPTLSYEAVNPCSIAATFTQLCHTVTFYFPHASMAGFSSSTRVVRHGESAYANIGREHEGYEFAGWDVPVDNVISDMVVNAVWDLTRYNITYEGTEGCYNPNPTTYTIEDEIHLVALTNTPAHTFAGWSTGMTLESGRTGDITIYAVWNWLPRDYDVEVEGRAETYSYGEEVYLRAQDEWKQGGTNVTCIGWIGTGCVPPHGTNNVVSFTLTGPGSIRWLYETNYLVNAWIYHPKIVSSGCTFGNEIALFGDGIDCEAISLWNYRTVDIWIPAGSNVVVRTREPEGAPLCFAYWGDTKDAIPICDADAEVLDDESLKLTVNRRRTVIAVLTNAIFKVTFDSGSHGDIVSGEAVQDVESFGSAMPPAVRPHDGCTFQWWDCAAGIILGHKPLENVLSNVVLTARYGLQSYAITYSCGPGSKGENPDSFTVDDEIVFADPEPVQGWRFLGWIPARIEKGSTGDIHVEAQWEEIKYSFNVDGTAREIRPGELVICNPPGEFDDGDTIVRCVGWTDGTGDVPPAGTARQVTFTATQPSSLTWVYATNHLVRTSRDSEPGLGQDAFFNFAYLDEFSGNGCYTMQSYVWQGDSVTFVAEPAENYSFAGWFDINTGLPVESMEGVEIEADDEARIYRLVIGDVEHPWSVRAEFSLRRCTATFDLAGHAVRTGGGELEQEIRYGKKAVAPKLSVDAAYKFIGWSHPLEAVYEDVTYVAQYEKIATRVDAGLVRGSEGLGSVSGGKVAKTGMSVTLKATVAKNCVFSGWFVDVDGTIPFAGVADHRAASCPVVTTGEDVVLYAKFIKLEEDWVTLDLPAEVTNVTKVAAAPINIGTEASSLPTVKVTGLPTGLKFTVKDVLKKGSKTEVEIPANTIYGTPSKSGIYVASVTATTAGKKSMTKSVKFIVRAPGETLVDAAWNADHGKVAGLGVCAVGKSLTLKATANKGYVFAGWYQDAAFTIPVESTADYRNPSIAIANNGSDQLIYALFVPSASDASISANVEASYNLNGPWSMKLDVDSLSLPSVMVKGLPAGIKFDAKSFMFAGTPTKPGSYSITLALKNVTVKQAVTQTFTIDVANIQSPYLSGIDYAKDAYVYQGGVAVDWDIASYAKDGYAITAVSGLPAGMKFNAKTGKIEGVPTKAGVFTATITLKNGRLASSATITIAVNGIDSWAWGTFNGGSPSNQVQLTISNAGKLSGKLLQDTITYTLTASSYSAYSDGIYYLDALAAWSYKEGKATIKTNDLWTIAVGEGAIGGTAEAENFAAWQNLWTQKAWKDLGAKLFGAKGLVQTISGEEYDLGEGESVVLTIKANGTVTMKGVFDTGTTDRSGKKVMYSASGSAVVCASEMTPFVADVFIYFAPNPSKNFEGYTQVVHLGE